MWANIWRMPVMGALLLAPTLAVAAVDPEIGLVFQEEYRGAIGHHPAIGERPLQFTDPVYAAEVVRTGAQASTALQFLDDTRLQIGANSTVVLDKFVFDPDQGVTKGAIDFGAGIFRYVGSGLAKTEALELRTPTAVMGIRGTKLIIYVAADGATTVAVIEGAVKVDPCGGDDAVAEAGYSAIVPASCDGASLVAGVATPFDPAVMADLPSFTDIQTAAGPLAAPEVDQSDHDPDTGGGTGGDTGGGDTGGGDTGGGDTGGGDTGGGDTGGGDTGGKPGSGNGNGNSGNPGNGGGNTGGNGPGTGNGGHNNGQGNGSGNGGGGNGHG